MSEYDKAFDEGQDEETKVNPAVALREQREADQAAALGEFTSEFQKEEAPAGDKDKK